MKIELLLTGKTSENYLREGISVFEKRLGHYVNFNIKVIPDLKNTKNLSSLQVMDAESKLILKELNKRSSLILLDEKGKGFKSTEFATFIENKMIMGSADIQFLVGGPYGFSDKIYKIPHSKISLSKMTFSHQMVRLLFVEQLYRAFTIIRGEPYHHK